MLVKSQVWPILGQGATTTTTIHALGSIWGYPVMDYGRVYIRTASVILYKDTSSRRLWKLKLRLLTDFFNQNFELGLPEGKVSLKCK